MARPAAALRDSIMQPQHLASALVSVFACASLAASCVQSPERAPTDSPSVETLDDDGDFGGDPDVGGSVGGDPDIGGSVGGDPAYSWTPPTGTPGDVDVGESESEPDAASSGGDASFPVLPSYSSSPSPQPRPPARTDTVSCYKFEGCRSSFGINTLRDPHQAACFMTAS
jgi:hypothetical protein